MKFLLDMGISPMSAAHLRRLGHEAVHLFEQHLEKLSDPDIVEKACLENRVLVTHDLDFGEIMAAPAAVDCPALSLFACGTCIPMS